ncbi:MAG: ACT domain-containing protein [Rhodanobacteraceae bacterium]
MRSATLIFSIEVKRRKHLANVMRKIRNTKVVNGVYRYPL